MSLSEGTRLGAYEITGQIGAGGMGEVYRATDTKLGRKVAIKTLPAALASDKDRLVRFEREAKLLAALNHPHIAVVHSLDEHEGTLYLAMELVEGETLEEKLKPGALPIGDALRLALQIAEALEAAHGKGVIHRDLKPANIMVNTEGQAKVLDFGLAKAFSNESEEVSPGKSPALSLAMTQQGIILGTAGYMSPEQASGQPTDQRADIWAFGVVLYEMLTGLPLFSGESVPHILADVLKTKPDWDRLPKNLHPRLRLMLERCLTKKPRNRYHSIADVRVDIEQVLGDPDGLHVQQVVQEKFQAQPFWRRPLPVGIGMLVLGVAITSVAALMLAPEPAPLNRFSYTMPSDLSFRREGENVIAVAPNGRHFVMNTTQGLFLRSMDALEARLIAGTEEDLDTPFFSPDSQSIAYWTPDGAIKRIGIRGGAPVVIANDVGNPLGASWERDGTILIADSTGILRFPANGGSPELLFPVGDNELFQAPQLLPDGDTILYSIAEGTNWDGARIVVQSVSTGERHVLIQGGSAARYVDSGHIVYALETDLFAMAFDADTLTVSGGVVPLVQDVSRALYIRAGLANYGISNDGSLIYRVGTDVGLSGRIPVWVDRDGREVPLGMQPCECIDPKVSPDGTRIAFQQQSGGNNSADIWIWSVAQGTFSRLTFGPEDSWSPVWSPDSQRIAYGTPDGLFIRRADGTGSVERMLEEGGIYPNTWSADGDIVYTVGSNGLDIGAVSVDGEPLPGSLLASSFGELRPDLSPDGRWIAYQSDETGRAEIYVRPYPDVEAGRWQISTGGGQEPQWSADSRTLFFVSPNSMMAASVIPASTFEFEPPEPLFDRADYAMPDSPRRYAVAGDQLLMLRISNPGNGNAEIVIVQNFVDELERLVPTE